MNNAIYNENSWPEFGVCHQWTNVTMRDAMVTHRGTLVEIVERPKWGLACYMDNEIQSCEADEKIYHEALVHPAMSHAKDATRVMVIGGGEGATVREVLKWKGVERVDMYEWDEDVVNLFKNKYTQWGKDAWNDSRLHLYYEDIFARIQEDCVTKYDVIIIDLFEPTAAIDKWSILLDNLARWIANDGAIAIYTGMRNIFCPKKWDMDDVNSITLLMRHRELINYKVYIPSFHGESTFALIKSVDAMRKEDGYITADIWKSYQTYNW